MGRFVSLKAFCFLEVAFVVKNANSPAIFKTIGGAALLLFTTTGKT